MPMRRVIKVGTSLLRGREGRSTEQVIDDLAASLCGLWQRGEPVVLVTSGAVGLGCHALGRSDRPSELEALQAAGVQKPVLQLGLPDRFIEHGDPARLLALQGLDAAGIERSVRERFGATLALTAA